MAYKYDPVLRMNVPVMTTDGYKIKATGKADTLEEAKKFLSKQGKNIEYSRARKSGSKYYFDNAIGDDVGEWDSSSKVVKAYDEKTWDHAIQAADASRIIEQKNGYTLGINSQGTICLAFPGETIDNPHMYLGKENEKNLADAKAMFKEFSNLRGK